MGILIDFNEAKKRLAEKKKQRNINTDNIEVEDLDNINDFFLHNLIQEIIKSDNGEDK